MQFCHSKMTQRAAVLNIEVFLWWDSAEECVLPVLMGLSRSFGVRYRPTMRCDALC